MKKITQLIMMICVGLVFTFTANAQITSSQVTNRVAVSLDMQNQIQDALSQQQSMESQNSNRALMATYVGSFNTNDGPSWTTNPPVLNGLEAAAFIFGGNPSDYAISTNPDTVDPTTITHTAWVTTWGISGCQQVAEDFSLDLGAPGYNDPGGNNTAISTYVNDNCIAGNVNYVWYVGGGSPNAFVTTWAVDISDLSITIPTYGGETYNYNVDWGDGSPVESGLVADATHNYAVPGTYTVEITGLFPQIYFNNSGDKDKIMSIEQWGDNPWTSMKSAFMGATHLVSNATDTPNFSNVTDMYGMFAYAESFNGDSNINNWDVSNVTNMYGLFGGAYAFNAYIGDWDVSSVTTMKLMFAHAYSFNQDIGNWDVSSVTNMESLFRVASSFDQNLGNWDVSNVANMRYMFKDVALSGANYDSLLNGWNSLTLRNGVVFSGGNSTYCYGEASRANMVSSFGWIITDGGKVCPADIDSFITTWEVDVLDLSAEIPTSPSATYDYTVDWGDGNSSLGQTGNATHTYAVPGVYEVKISGLFPTIYFNNGGDKLKIKSIEQWGTNVWGSSMRGAFEGCQYLVSNAVDTPNFSNVTDMYGMFAYAENFNGDLNINNWDVSNVTNMFGMFGGALSFNANIGNWDVSNVTSMKFMFYGSLFNQDISSWDVSSVRNMESMFRRVEVFNQDLGNWDVSNVNNMSNMFKWVTLSTDNYDSLLMGWSSLPLQANVDFHGGFSAYCGGAAARQSIIDNFGWTFIDGGFDCAAPLADRLDMDELGSMSEISFYPNPTRGQLNLVNPENLVLESASIYDMTGRLIKTLDLKGMNSEVSLDVSMLSKATYMVVVNGNQGQISKLVIKE